MVTPFDTNPRQPELTPETLSRVSPRDVQGYVKSHGWLHSGRVGGLLVFSREGSLDQVLVPTDATKPDFAERMFDVVQKLTRFESRFVKPVLTDLMNYGADVVRYRIKSQPTRGGTIPLPQAIELLQGAKQSLLSAAHSVLAPLKHHPKLSRSDAVTLVDACRMGQTEHRSFGITLACPMDAVDQDQAGVFDDGMPFARQATRLLGQALASLNLAIEEDRVNSVVDEPDPIVSANLCQALLQMRPEHESGVLEFSASWASSFRESGPASSTPVAFSADEFGAVEEVYRQLRPTAQTNAIKTNVAYVDELQGVEGSDGRREGEVVFNLLDEDELVKTKARLNADDYAIAHQAHSPSKILWVRGRLSRGPRVSRLSDIEYVRPVENDDATEARDAGSGN